MALTEEQVAERDKQRKDRIKDLRTRYDALIGQTEIDLDDLRDLQITVLFEILDDLAVMQLQLDLVTGGILTLRDDVHSLGYWVVDRIAGVLPRPTPTYELAGIDSKLNHIITLLGGSPLHFDR